MFSVVALALPFALSAADGFISGVVFNQDRTPAPRAVVTLSTSGAKPKDAVAITDERGRFGFYALPPGQYYLHADVEDCGAAWYGARSAEQPAAILTLSPGENRQDIALRCMPLSSISGTVLDADGDPVFGANVSLLMARYERWKPKFTPMRGAMSNSRGEYRIGDVPPGKYIVMAKTWGGMARVVQPEGVDAQTPEGLSYGFQLFRNSDRLSSATPLDVGGRKEITGIDFRLPVQHGARVEGKVTVPADLDGKTQVQVTAYSIDLPETLSQSMSTGAAAPDYNFSIPNLVPGSYVLIAQASSGERQYRAVARLELAEDSTGVSLLLEPGVELPGRVLLEGATDSAFRPARVVLSAGDVIGAQTMNPVAEVKPDGAFLLPNVLPGIWDIGVGPLPPGGYIKSMRLGEHDVLLDDMLIAPDSKGPLNIVVSTRGAVVSGKVVKEDAGAASPKAARAVVLLAPEGKLRPVWTFYSAISTDDEGRFEFRGVTPGSYRLFAFENMAAEAYQNPDFLSPFRDRGEIFEVPEGARISRQVPLMEPAPAGGGR